jgi:8-oxo-dGTP diphosphatase
LRSVRQGKAYAGYWEFPGGKLEPGETPRDALGRELAEELGIDVRRAAPWLVQRYRYPHAHVELHFFRVLEWTGEPVGHDGQAFEWQVPGRFDVAPLLPANTMVLRALMLPRVYGITMADELGDAELLARAEIALERGLRLIQLREKTSPVERQRALAEKLVALARRRGAKVCSTVTSHPREPGDATACISRHARCARRHRARAIFFARHRATRAQRSNARASSDSTSRCSARSSRHPRIRARRRSDGTDFAAIVAGTTLPVFALGGLGAADLDEAVAHGAHGIALRRAAWL